MASVTIKSIQERAVVFELGTTRCCLTLADSKHCGWRLQTGKDPAAQTGASQSLAMFLGEQMPDAAEPIRVEKDGAAYRVLADCGAQVLLEAERLVFITPEGKAAASLMEIVEENGKTIISGQLEDGEAIYGCGERFNRLNMRCTSFDMFTCDGWNNSSTTYVAIPLFTTSRGAGVFVNRYERMLFDFGEEKTDEWKISLLHEHADMYVFATGRMIDAIDGYMDLSGRPAKVHDWFAGPQLCRYAPDYRWLKGQTVDKRPKTVREVVTEDGKTVKADVYFVGDGVVDIVKRFCSMDAKPKAVIFEGWSAVSAFEPDDPSKTVVIACRGANGELLFEDEEKTDLKTVTVPATTANNKQALKDCADYLHSLGIKLMMYAPVGGCCVDEKNVPGWKEEYLLHISMKSAHPDYDFDSFIGAPWMVCADTVNVDVSREPGAENAKGVMLDMSRHFNYLDITNDEAWDWYINTIWKELIDLGVDGVKIDFCEVLPDSGSRYGIRGTDAVVDVQLLWQHPEKLYGTVGCEHHAYASFFVSKFLRDVSAYKQDGFMLLSRGGGIGSQRNPYMWAGDQCRAFEKLDDQLFAVLNAGLSGLPYMTYDCGGYHYARPTGDPISVHTREDGSAYMLAYYCPSQADPCYDVADETSIFMRAIQFTTFSANVQTHGDVLHAYEMKAEGQRLYTLYMKLHGLLQAYIDRCNAETAATGMPVSRHMMLEFGQDAACRDLEDQYMFGSGLLVTPVYQKGAGVRQVYLPQGIWRDLRSGGRIAGGTFVEAAYDERTIPVFLREDCADTQTMELLEKVFAGDVWQQIVS